MRLLQIDNFSPPEEELIRACARVLERIPETRVVVRKGDARRDDQRDAHLSVQDGDLRTPYTVECKRHLAAVLDSTVRQVQALADEHKSRPMIMTTYVNDAMGEHLRAERVDYIDTAGNAFIQTALPPLTVFFRGHKPGAKAPRPGRVFHGASGLQLVALLLTAPARVTRTYRELAHDAGISLGSASQLMAELRHEGYIRPGKKELANSGEMLEQWMQGYHARLRPQLFKKTYRTTEGRGPEDLIAMLTRLEDVWIGGELAAGITTRGLRPARAALHIPAGSSPERLMRELRLIPDAGGNVDIMRRFGSGDVWARTGPRGLPLIAPLFVYAELLETPDDRLREVARAVYDREIAPYVPGLTDGG
ncbi:MAG TPA: type IV toxin-antitoxin system AbiEi family antitoxin [Phycisphaerae bacterium]|nr:type IV toxin-antitoxin system AbiEi family antitoxin [Phycisphaerae bacterium]